MKVSNTVLLAVSATFGPEHNPRTEIVDSWGLEIMDALYAQKLPTTVVTVTNIQELPIKVKITFHQNDNIYCILSLKLKFHV